MVELYLGSCILVELCIGRVLVGLDVNVPISLQCQHYRLENLNAFVLWF